MLHKRRISKQLGHSNGYPEHQQLHISLVVWCGFFILWSWRRSSYCKWNELKSCCVEATKVTIALFQCSHFYQLSWFQFVFRSHSNSCHFSRRTTVCLCRRIIRPFNFRWRYEIIIKIIASNSRRFQINANRHGDLFNPLISWLAIFNSRTIVVHDATNIAATVGLVCE